MITVAPAFAQVASTTSAGIAFARPGDTATGLVRKADLAMYASKLAGKGQVEEYVREQPIKALAIAAGVGVVLGILWKRS